MANVVSLNNVTHKDLKIITKYSEQFGNNVSAVLTFPTEFADMQREYPILFQKNVGCAIPLAVSTILFVYVTPPTNFQNFLA
jgi:hypothetical protein